MEESTSSTTPKEVIDTNDKKVKEKKAGRLNDSPDVQLSKTLSYILRHGAVREKLNLRSDGFVRLDHLLARPKLKNVTVQDIYRVVDSNEKQRFAIVEEMQSDGVTVSLIRANQGHSLLVKDLDLTLVKDPSEIPIVVHGTYRRSWNRIVKQGLKPMKRTHIHFAKGLVGEDGILSGMRRSCEIYIYLDVEKCFKDQIQFYISPNGVILSEGLPESKSIPSRYFKSAVTKEGDTLRLSREPTENSA